MRWTTFWAGILTTALTAAPAYADVSQAEVTAFFNAHPPAGVQRFSVVEQIEYHPGGNDFTKSTLTFDPATTKVTPQSNSLSVKDGSGKEALVPYSAIKSLAYGPETDKVYSHINILVQ